MRKLRNLKHRMSSETWMIKLFSRYYETMSKDEDNKTYTQSPLDPLKSRRRQHTLQIKHWQCQKCSPRSQRATAGNIFHLCSSYSKFTVMEFIAFHFNKTLCLSLTLGLHLTGCLVLLCIIQIKQEQ